VNQIQLETLMGNQQFWLNGIQQQAQISRLDKSLLGSLF